MEVLILDLDFKNRLTDLFYIFISLGIVFVSLFVLFIWGFNYLYVRHFCSVSCVFFESECVSHSDVSNVLGTRRL